ncbi:helix-turn-helix domain-containing protein [Tenacibaculum sp. C7A-26P2]|uniref:helix-turn-helix domain-containing protein n=1 Tax=Tenacibaculum sp. C7A-26P2 TaxID=3447504 RepID=UPI003F878AB2
MIIIIKNMVCSRCKMVVNSIFIEIGLHPKKVILGEVEIKEKDISSVRKRLEERLNYFGFEILTDSKEMIVEKVKITIIDLVQNQNSNLNVKLSEYLKQEIHKDYSTLSNIFSEFEKITIEKYFILQKVEKVKELLGYNEFTLSEIALQLNYSSVAYLSNQFKKVTGLSPSQFKKTKFIKRKSIETL